MHVHTSRLDAVSALVPVEGSYTYREVHCVLLPICTVSTADTKPLCKYCVRGSVCDSNLQLFEFHSLSNDFLVCAHVL
jgi:hypothetical protein